MALLFWAVTAWQQRDLIKPSQVAPSFTLAQLATHTPTPIHMTGQRTLIYFFAPWCSICKLSMSNLNHIDTTNLRVVAVALDYQDEASVAAFIADQEIHVPILLGTSEVAAAFRINVFPTYYVLDEKGSVDSRSVGYSSEIGMKLRTGW